MMFISRSDVNGTHTAHCYAAETLPKPVVEKRPWGPYFPGDSWDHGVRGVDVGVRGPPGDACFFSHSATTVAMDMSQLPPDQLPADWKTTYCKFWDSGDRSYIRKRIRQQGMGSFVRNSYVSRLCPVVICPYLCTSEASARRAAAAPSPTAWRSSVAA